MNFDIKRYENIINSYKANFDSQWPNEKYKWEAISWFQGNWDITADDFPNMLKTSISKLGNLINSGMSYPSKMIFEFAEEEPEKVRAIFKHLYDEESGLSLEQRVNDFKNECKAWIEKRNLERNKNDRHCQDDNAISSYLWVRYPEKYYLYKYRVILNLASYLRYKGFDRNNCGLIKQYAFYDEVKELILEDEELINALKSRINEEQFKNITVENSINTLVIDIGYHFRAYMWKPRSKDYVPKIDGKEMKKDKWLEILLSETIYNNDNDIKTLKRLLENDGYGSCKELSNKYGESLNFYNNAIRHIGQYVSKTYSCDLYEDQFWPIPCVGRTDKKTNTFVYALRSELLTALKDAKIQKRLDSVELYEEENNESAFEEEKCMINIPLNQILYGPPGTGKTYNTVVKAVDICDWDKEKPADYDAYLERYRQLQKEGRIAFTTFHQAYGYEEFIEGIKPVLGDSKKENHSDLKYEIKSGVFKEFCEAETEEYAKTLKNLEIRKDAKVWKATFYAIGDNIIRQDCLDNNRIRIKDNIDEWENGVVGGKYIGDVPVFQALVNDMKIGDIVISHFGKDTIDAIGVITSDYENINPADNLNITEQEAAELSVMQKLHYFNYKNSRKVKWLLKENINVSSYLKNKFQSNPAIYHLEDISVDAVLKILTEHNVINSVEVVPKNKVFIIDEINRGNISKIFGELITLIEDSKREGASEAMSVTLPYSGKPFGVPKNVYILGTMNTADRSIAMMDTALRRRFEFEEMLPRPELLDDVNVEGVNIGGMLRKINERIEFLYDREHTIGHAFFMELKESPNKENLKKIFKNKVIPLLQEYFYDDYSKIMLVLGDDNPNKTENEKFIKKNVLNKNVFFSATSSDALEAVNDVVYEINAKALDNIEAYEKIGTKLLKTES